MINIAKLYTNLVHPEENILTIAKQLVRLLNVPLTTTTLKKELEAHPNYPSMLSMSDVLQKYKIANLAVRLDLAKLKQLDTPYIAHVKDEKTGKMYYTLVKDMYEDRVIDVDHQTNSYTERTWDNFSKRYKGVVLLAEAEEHAGEKEYEAARKKEIRHKLGINLALLAIPLLTVLSVVWAIWDMGVAVLPSAAHLLMSFIGLAIGSLLLWYEVDSQNTALQEVCSGAGHKANCGALLHSGASSVFGFSWSLIGFSYFAGSFLSFIVFGLVQEQIVFFLSWLALLAALYIPFSLYYQWRVAKQWCTLCLGVQALLALQLANVLLAGWPWGLSPSGIQAHSLLLLAGCFAFPFIGTYYFIPVLKKNKEARNNQLALLKLKNDPMIFDALLSNQKAVTVNADGLGILLGNPEAKNRIIKVCNPYCGPCAKAHPKIEELLQASPDLCVQILFTAANDDQDSKAAPVRHLMAIAQMNDGVLLKQALDNWYNAPVKDYAAFARLYPLNGELKAQGKNLEAMSLWCKEMDISATPTYFVNGHQLPKSHRLQDLRYLLT